MQEKDAREKLRELDLELQVERTREKASLRERIHQTPAQYYSPRRFKDAVLLVLSFAGLIFELVNERPPLWGVMVFGFAFVAFCETVRQRDRFDAWLQLQKMDVEDNA